MPYTPKTWADGPAGNTPITAAELNRMEQGIDNSVEKGGDTVNGSLTLASTAAGGLDTTDSTSRLTVQSYQTNGNNFFGEGFRMDLMRPMAKNMIAWRLPRDPGFDDPSTLRSVTWMGAHYYAQDQIDMDNPIDVHGHWSIEVPDAGDALRTRFEIPFTKPDGTIGVDKTNIKTNLADLTVRAENNQVFRVGAGNSHNKNLVFAVDDGTSGTGTRWRIRVDNTTETAQNDGSDFRIMRLSNDNSTFDSTAVFIRRKDGRVVLGGMTTAPSSMLHIQTATATEGLLFLSNTNASPTGPIISADAGASSGTFMQAGVIGETSRRFSSNMSGRFEWGSGAATRDTILYRSAVGRLKTDTEFEVGTNLVIGARTVITPTTDQGSSVSNGGAFLLTNTGHIGAGAVLYTNRGADATGRLLVVNTGNAANTQTALHVQHAGSGDAQTVTQSGTGRGLVISAAGGATASRHALSVALTGTGSDTSSAATITSTNTAHSAMQVTGVETARGTVKIAHTGSGTDETASALSLDLQGTGTASQGLFIDSTATSGTSGRLINARNKGVEQLTLTPEGDFSTSFLKVTGRIAATTNAVLGGVTEATAVGTFLGLGNIGTAPTGNPVGGLVIWSEGGTLRHRTSGGVVKNLSAAVEGTGINNIVKITQAAYDALGTKDANTLYVIEG